MSFALWPTARDKVNENVMHVVITKWRWHAAQQLCKLDQAF